MTARVGSFGFVALLLAACPPFASLEFPAGEGEGEGEGEAQCTVDDEPEAGACRPFVSDGAGACRGRGESVGLTNYVGRVVGVRAIAAGPGPADVFALDDAARIWTGEHIAASDHPDDASPDVGLALDVAPDGRLLWLAATPDQTVMLRVRDGATNQPDFDVGVAAGVLLDATSPRHRIVALNNAGSQALVVAPLVDGTLAVLLADLTVPAAVTATSLGSLTPGENEQVAVARRADPEGAGDLVAAVVLSGGEAAAIRAPTPGAFTFTAATLPEPIDNPALAITSLAVLLVGNSTVDEEPLFFTSNYAGFPDGLGGASADIAGLQTNRVSSFVAAVGPQDCAGFAGSSGFIAHGERSDPEASVSDLQVMGGAHLGQIVAVDATEDGDLWIRTQGGFALRYETPPCHDLTVVNPFGLPDDTFTLDPDAAADHGGSAHAILNDGRYVIAGESHVFALSAGGTVVDATLLPGEADAAGDALVVVFAHDLGDDVLLVLADGRMALWNGLAANVDLAAPAGVLPLTEMPPAGTIRDRGLVFAVDDAASTADALSLWIAGRDRVEARLLVQHCTVAVPPAGGPLTTACGTALDLDESANDIDTPATGFRLHNLALDESCASRAVLRTSNTLYLLALDADVADVVWTHDLQDIVESPQQDRDAVATFVKAPDREPRILLTSSSASGVRSFHVDGSAADLPVIEEAFGVLGVARQPHAPGFIGVGDRTFYTLDAEKLFNNEARAIDVLGDDRPVRALNGIAVGGTTTWVFDANEDVWALRAPADAP